MHILKTFIEKDSIAEKVSELALRLNKDFAGQKNILIISILKGSFVFTADLTRQLNFSFDLEFLEISSYGNEMKSGEAKLISNFNFNPAGKKIIIIEDIIDTGNTVVFLNSLFEQYEFNKIEYVALLFKEEKYSAAFPVNYIGFKIPDSFVAGYGMDCGGKYRNLPYIVTVHEA